MNLNMNKYLLCFLLSITIFIIFAPKAYADAGPKTSVTIHVKGIEGDYIITLLSDVKSTGPYSVGRVNYIDDSAEHRKLMEKFLAFEDDEYYILGYYDILNGDDDFTWGYHPPDNFKVLIYSIDKDEFYLSDKLSRYSFYSHFTTYLKDGKLILKKDYVNSGGISISMTILMFLGTLFFTLFVELLLALLFKYKNKEIVYIARVNIATQIGLYLFITLGTRFTTAHFLVLMFIAELIIWIIEISLYAARFDNKNKAIGYGILANLLSYFLPLLPFVFMIFF